MIMIESSAKLIATACLCLIYGFVFGQSLSEDLVRCYENLGTSDSLHIKMDISYYPNATSNKIESVRSAELKSYKGIHFTKIDGVAMLVNGDKALLIDEASKSVFWQTLSKQQQNSLKEKQDFTGLQMRFDSLLVNAGNIERTKLEGGIVEYRFDLVKTDISSVVILLDERTGMFKKIVYHYNKEFSGTDGRVEVNYSFINLFPVFSADEFVIEKYIIKEGKTFKTTPAYGRYNLYEIDFSEI